ncbi:hypothetical protein BC832DRAFT_223390 [Gaertneriomyces semiglobifer]|nr:hypothetical protein BC832DRAFT_223390 [Gaertneriomyces semiglobifer]
MRSTDPGKYPISPTVERAQLNNNNNVEADDSPLDHRPSTASPSSSSADAVGPNGEPITPRKRGRPRKEDILAREQMEEERATKILYDSLTKLLIVLETEDPANNPPLTVLREKVESHSYMSLSEFQEDFDAFFKAYLCNSESASPSYKTVTQLWRLGRRIINSLYDKIPARKEEEEEGIRTRRRTREEGRDKALRYQKYVLTQRTPSGEWLFSGLIHKPLDDLELVDDVYKTAVVPTPNEPPASIPSLASCMPPKSTTSKNFRPERRRMDESPVNFLNYGEFFSFAPQYDSSAATLTAAESVRMLNPNRKVILDIVPRALEADDQTDDQEEKENTPADVTDKGTTAAEVDTIDVDAVLAELAPTGTSSETTVVSTEQLLLKNAALLVELETQSDARLVSATPHVASSKELETARKLADNLSTLVAQAKPSELVDKAGVQQAMELLKKFDGAWRGTTRSVGGVVKGNGTVGGAGVRNPTLPLPHGVPLGTPMGGRTPMAMSTPYQQAYQAQTPMSTPGPMAYLQRLMMNSAGLNLKQFPTGVLPGSANPAISNLPATQPIQLPASLAGMAGLNGINGINGLEGVNPTGFGGMPSGAGNLPATSVDPNGVGSLWKYM